MIPVFVDRMLRPEPNGAGYEQLEQRYREVLGAGREVRLEAGKRAEFDVPQGQQAVVYVIEGAVRFEGDDTGAAAGTVVYFKPAGDPDAKLGLEADMPFRGAVAIGAPRASPQA
jgi:redox-sensitive bicupin YhaK (pirin superfamily)